MKSLYTPTTIFCPSEEKSAANQKRLIDRSLHVKIPGSGEFEGDAVTERDGVLDGVLLGIAVLDGVLLGVGVLVGVLLVVGVLVGVIEILGVLLDELVGEGVLLGGTTIGS